MTDVQLPINIIDIFKYLPHRYPFLLIDKVLAINIHKSITAIKNVSINEPYFAGHFPGYPVMPGVLILEAMAQAAGILAVSGGDVQRNDSEICFLAGINDARFKRQVLPGDQLVLEVELVKTVRSLSKYKALAMVDQIMAAEAELLLINKELEHE